MVLSATSYFRASGAMVPLTDATTSPKSIGSHVALMLPASDRAMSSMLLIISNRMRLFFSISSQAWRSEAREGSPTRTGSLPRAEALARVALPPQAVSSPRAGSSP